MKRPTFYLDLDRTIFHTERIGEFFPILERLYPSAALRNGYEHRARYFVFPHRQDGDDKTYYYDLVSQLQGAGLDLGEAFTALRTELGDGRFEYEGARELVRALKELGVVKILTYGEDVYQRFKVSLCPSLVGLEVVTTVDPKVDYLNAYAVAGDWIIDDKVIPGLTADMHALRIQHERGEVADAYSLAEVAAIISRHMSTGLAG